MYDYPVEWGGRVFTCGVYSCFYDPHRRDLALIACTGCIGMIHMLGRVVGDLASIPGVV
jgi:hypothetical protein